jgi:hypothetical protein
MRSLLALFSLLLSIQATYAQDVASRMTTVYLKTDKNFDIDCRFSFNSSFKLLTPVSDTIKGPDFIRRDFQIESATKTASMTFLLQKQGKDYEYLIRFNDKHISKDKLSKRDFNISPIDDASFANEFETSKIYCFVNFAYAAPQIINDGDYHINIHPHRSYDWQSLLKAPVEDYLNNPNYKSFVLLEAGNYRGNLVNITNFLNGVNYQLPQNDYGGTDLEHVPLEVPFIVSPAGHNRYILKANSQLNVTFTGGNHNYCIWNNTRFVMEALMRSKSNAKLNIFYDTKTIVAQSKGMERVGINFSKKDVNQSNLLFNLLKDENTRSTYHLNYHYYFKTFFLKEFLGMFKTLKLVYQAQGYEREDIIQGTGTRDLEIGLIYLY